MADSIGREISDIFSSYDAVTLLCKILDLSDW